MKPIYSSALLIAASALLVYCNDKTTGPSATLIKEMSLKKGEVISCGPADQQLGTVRFAITGSAKVAEGFSLGLKLLHSFEYDEAEKVFASVIDESPECAMAYWGVAMSNFHALWAPPSEAELKKGAKAIEIGRSIKKKTEKETDYIEAIAAFYTDWASADHRTRANRFEKGTERLYAKYPDDKEAAVFYALALNAAADPADKSFAKQKKAGTLLEGLYPAEPNHPGIMHYIIHTYDYPELAERALPVARKYASVAPSSAHALHMPSHIFTRLGLWDECIASNLGSVSSAQCYAQQAGINGHWDEELHGMDYLVYAYLQKGDNESAKRQWDYLNTIDHIEPANFKVAYTFAAIPARYVLENKLWKEATTLQLPISNLKWENFAWQKGILHFARLMGFVHTNDLKGAGTELTELKKLHQNLIAQKDAYKAGQLAIQIKTAEAWVKLREGKKAEAISLMQEAANMEDKTEKHPVTPGEVIPARELLGDMLMEAGDYTAALQAYELDLQKHPNRFNGLFGAGQAAEKAGDADKAKLYYGKLVSVAGQGKVVRQEVRLAKHFLDKYKA